MREISIFATLHAISGQRYHDNTPAVAAAGPDAVDRGTRLLHNPASFWHVRGEKGEMKEKNPTRDRNATTTTKRQILHKTEAPQSRRIVAFSSLSRVSLSQAHIMEQKLVILSR